MGRVADMPEVHTSIQRDLDRMEKWADRNLMKFNQEKCKVLHLWRNDPVHQDVLEATSAGKQLCRKGPRSPGGLQVEHESAVCPCC